MFSVIDSTQLKSKDWKTIMLLKLISVVNLIFWPLFGFQSCLRGRIFKSLRWDNISEVIRFEIDHKPVVIRIYPRTISLAVLDHGVLILQGWIWVRLMLRFTGCCCTCVSIHEVWSKLPSRAAFRMKSLKHGARTFLFLVIKCCKSDGHQRGHQRENTKQRRSCCPCYGWKALKLLSCLRFIAHM